MPFSFPGSYNTKRVARKAREIQKEADKRVEEKGLWRGGKKEKRKTKGREKR